MHISYSQGEIQTSGRCNLKLNGARIKAVEETGDMYSAIDQVMDKIEKQVKRHLSKIKDHRVENARGEETSVLEEVDESTAFAQEETIIEVEKMIAKPMDPEEAAMQLNLVTQGFLVFRNAKSREINVIYKRADGNLGLIEPSN